MNFLSKYLPDFDDWGAWLEVLILWGGIYVMLRFLRGTRGFGVFRGLVLLIGAVWIGVLLLDASFGVPRLKEMVTMITPALIIMLAILFQPEIRQGISRLGHGGLLGFLAQEEEGQDTIRRIASAAIRMAKERTGALIAFERTVSLAPFRENAVKIEAPVTTILVESIFFHGNPLHDGGVIIKGGNILSAAAIFPLTDNPDVQRRMGTRHRAAIGITEETDAIAMVVSEETGQISLAAGGQLYQQVPFDKLEEYLAQLLRRGRRWTGPDKEKAGQPVIKEPISKSESGMHAKQEASA